MTKRVWDAEMTARAAGMKRAGFTAKQISERLGVTSKAVNNKMQKTNVRSRLDGKGGMSSHVHNFQTGRLTADLLEKTQRVDEYLEKSGQDDYDQFA